MIHRKSKHGFASVDRPAKTYIHQFCVDTGCRLDDLPLMMEEIERVREVCVISRT